jgi:hypothetical protein
MSSGRTHEACFATPANLVLLMSCLDNVHLFVYLFIFVECKGKHCYLTICQQIVNMILSSDRHLLLLFKETGEIKEIHILYGAMFIMEVYLPHCINVIRYIEVSSV